MAQIEVRNLIKSFGRVKAVDDVSFSVSQGEIFGFLGPNGAGKTTTIRCIMDFYRPTEGRVSLFGLDSVKAGVAARSRIGFMPPTTSLNERWTGQDHIAYAKALRRQPNTAADLIDRLDFNPSVATKHLSTGNRQKLSLILAFMFKAELIILDEPTNGLDPLLQQTVYDLILETRHRGATVFMSSHNLSEVERMCTRVAILRAGKLVATEPMTALKDKHLYSLSVQFTENFDIASIKLPNATVTRADKRTADLKASGDIAPLLKALTQTPLHDLTISHATLEEMFLEFYNH
jgi:ABC-2 type transport system ATP-binding protein